MERDGGDGHSTAVDFDDLYSRLAPWILERVRAELGPGLRRKADSGDYVQEVLGRFWKLLPDLEIKSEDEMKRLLSTIVLRVIRSAARFYATHKRDISRERPLDEGGTFPLGLAMDQPTPSSVARRRDDRARFEFAFALLSPDEQRVLESFQEHGATWFRVGSDLGVTPDAARMRYGRARLVLVEKMRMLAVGQIDRALGD